jgi:ribosomal protein S18 acetylase RimI-like enzyme
MRGNMTVSESGFDFEILQLRAPLDPGDVDRINVLLRQLSNRARPLNIAMLTLVVETHHVFVARHEGHIIGTATLVTTYQLTGTRCSIQDVVVDQDFRRRGIGEQLTLALITCVPPDARSLELTSNPTREDARRLYEKLGFEQRNTTVYRFNLELIQAGGPTE